MWHPTINSEKEKSQDNICLKKTKHRLEKEMGM